MRERPPAAWIGNDMSKHDNERFCLAEYCNADFYMGWWLYERETNDGHRNSDGSRWGWLRDESSRNKLHSLCQRMGHEPPPVTRHSQAFAEWFAATFPNGLRVRVNEDAAEHYELIEIVKRRPRQRRGAIRTIRGAERAETTRRINKDTPAKGGSA